MKNPHAQALGRLNKGGKKTMSPAAIRQRKLASKQAAKKRIKLRPKRLDPKTIPVYIPEL